jgi:hypothetical protein
MFHEVGRPACPRSLVQYLHMAPGASPTCINSLATCGGSTRQVLLAVTHLQHHLLKPWDTQIITNKISIQRSGFDSWHYHIIWAVVGLERGPLSPVSTTEELLGRKSSGSGQESRDYGVGDPLRWPRDSPLSANVDTNFVDKLWSLGRYRSLGRYSSLAD